MNRVAPSHRLPTVHSPSHRQSTARSLFASFWLGPRRASVFQTWSKILYRSPEVSPWFSALRIQAVVLRNAATSIACACIPNAFYAMGNLFSGRSYLDQSRFELIVANSVWACVAFCTVVFLSFLPLMRSVRFLDSPDCPPSIWFCIKRLARATFVYFIGAVVAMFGFGYLAAYLSVVHPSSYRYKIESYADNLSLLGYFTGITRAVKKIYYTETCQGRDRLTAKQRKLPKPAARPPGNATVSPIPDPDSALPTRYRTPKFWKAYLRNIPSATPPLLATAFVHVLSLQRIVDRGATAITSFVVSGIVFKLVIQELAKHYVLKKRVRSTRVMCVLVGVPTVLIDTQTRIILLGSSSTQTAVYGTLGMAAIEIALRVGKARLVIWNIARRELMLSREHKSTPSRQSSLSELVILGIEALLAPPTRPSVSAMHVEFAVWRRQVQAFHTAELNADMYAEYIAIGCSVSIVFFYGNHQHYSLLRQSIHAMSNVDEAAWRVNQLYMLAFQVGLEVLVDYVSIVLEMKAGIEFDHVKNLGAFLAALFMVAAVMNITISIGVYLS